MSDIQHISKTKEKKDWNREMAKASFVSLIVCANAINFIPPGLSTYNIGSAICLTTGLAAVSQHYFSKKCLIDSMSKGLSRIEDTRQYNKIKHQYKKAIAFKNISAFGVAGVAGGIAALVFTSNTQLSLAVIIGATVLKCYNDFKSINQQEAADLKIQAVIRRKARL